MKIAIMPLLCICEEIPQQCWLPAVSLNSMCCATHGGGEWFSNSAPKSLNYGLLPHEG